MTTMRHILVLALILGLAGAAVAQESRSGTSWSSARARGISTSRSPPRWSRSTTWAASSGQWDTYFRTDCTAITKKPLKWGAKNLNDFDAVVFFTDGDLDMDDSQKADLLSFVRDDGKGFIGIHSAAITFIVLAGVRQDARRLLRRPPLGRVRRPAGRRGCRVPRHGAPAPRASPSRTRSTRSRISRATTSACSCASTPARSTCPRRASTARTAISPSSGPATTARGASSTTAWGITREVWDRPEIQKMWLEMVQWSMGLIPGDATPKPRGG